MRDPDRYLESLEPLGTRFGLERIRALTEALGSPQSSFASVHIVGTNGKSSVARMIEALLGAHGIAAGAYVSPHLAERRERVSIAGEVIGREDYAAAVERVAEVIEGLTGEDRVGGGPAREGSAGGGAAGAGPVTQFEASTAAAFVALESAGVEVAAIEAGLGGRLDATNVIESELTVLTGVGLDHTEWLGSTVTEIATEKLAVLERGTALVVGEPPGPGPGPGLRPGPGSGPGPVLELARQTAAEREAEVIEPRAAPAGVVEGQFQRRNLGLAIAACERMLAARGRVFSLDERDLVRLAPALRVPGRLERLPGPVEAILDVAHNRDGALALAEALPEVVGDRPVVCCIALQADKDAAAIATALAPVVSRAVCTEIDARELARSGRPGAEPMPATATAAAFTVAGVEAEVADDPRRALECARTAAAGEGASVLVCGSHHLVTAARRAWLCDDKGHG